jgi:hypothetical protein
MVEPPHKFSQKSVDWFIVKRGSDVNSMAVLEATTERQNVYLYVK